MLSALFITKGTGNSQREFTDKKLPQADFMHPYSLGVHRVVLRTLSATTAFHHGRAPGRLNKMVFTVLHRSLIATALAVLPCTRLFSLRDLLET